ncbi:hypothetical protein [uncultured Empedobacter sp.]|uniref:hypothetical protein n=1 Tax=uncultured Empedobacter sp. TaxID=410844 RepID=UPI0025D9D04C|nr:hypothetical protein [uncultured Empedobacter sp.]
MATIKDKIKACDYVLANILDEQERIVYRNEPKIIAMNTAQFEQGMGSDDKTLFNKNPIFDGTYSLSTALMNNRKSQGSLYNFYVTGDFLRGLQLEIRPNLVQFDIFSTGTGSGDKSVFFAGYTNLYGLNKENNKKLQYQIILPELTRWIKRYL